MINDLDKAILDASLKSLSIQNNDGSFCPGHNGPYRHKETPLRNTAHWLIVICYLIDLDKTSKRNTALLTEAANKAVGYLLSEIARPHGYSFFCREHQGKDSCNGLIGQAWVIEGLLEAYRVLGIVNARKVALEVFLLHPFNFDKGLWTRVEIDGNLLGFDYTFNHQLWFAAIASELDNKDASERVKIFFDKVARNIEIYNDGIIFHAANVERFQFLDFRNPIRLIKLLKSKLIEKKIRNNLYIKSVGYHSFNLYAFAILKYTQILKDDDFWNSDSFRKMYNVTTNSLYIENLDNNKYAWTYNPPGIELAYFGKVFSLGEEYIKKWLYMQTERTFDNLRNDLMTRNSLDISTSSARIYEAVRFLKLK